jgi:glycosyltransferase involved in cell wall biosynthesis
MTSIGHDDPISMRQRGFLLNYCFSKADAYVGVTSHFNKLYAKSQLPLNRYIEIPNGVDIDRFRPAVAGEREILRDQLGLPTKIKLILFVGHFSREKCPDILLEAWKYFVAETFLDTGVIFVGATKTNHYEVDPRLVEDIQELAAPYINERIFFIERAHEIEKYYQTADIFVLPSLREGLPNALLEAMACCLPVITSRLEGVTDWIVEDGKNGLLLKSVIEDDLGKALISMLKDEIQAHLLGLKARETVLERFSMEKVAEEYLELYRRLTPLA